LDGKADRRDAKARIVARALELGFDLVAVAAAETFEETRSVFERRAADGMLGQWRFPPEKIARHTTPSSVLAGARSIVLHGDGLRDCR
jgi:epoxyqueuosine reductase QueG